MGSIEWQFNNSLWAEAGDSTAFSRPGGVVLVHTFAGGGCEPPAHMGSSCQETRVWEVRLHVL